jgi:class 3 adenylate cyclase
MTQNNSQSSSPSNIKTVLEVDLVSYSDIARALEESLDVEAVRLFEDQIQKFVDSGLAAVGVRRKDVVLGTAGDNAILIFDNAATMHRFADSVQRETVVHNSRKSFDLARRWFRMGAATGVVRFLPERRIVGTTIARAVRLEAAASKGQLVVDVETFEALPDQLKNFYGAEETISGKRDERFRGRRCTFVAVPPENVVLKVAESEPTGKLTGSTRDELIVIYDLYRTCYLNQKYYGYKLRRATEAGKNKKQTSKGQLKCYESLFKNYTAAAASLRLLVDEIRGKKSLSRRMVGDYRRVREIVVELEQMDEPNPDRALIKRFEQQVNREIPVEILWFPPAGT